MAYVQNSNLYSGVKTSPEDQYFTEQDNKESYNRLKQIHPVFLDQEGRAKLIYHGSPTGRSITDCGYFDDEYYGDNTGVRDSSEGFTVFASDDETVADTYTFARKSTYSLEEQKELEEHLKEIKQDLQDTTYKLDQRNNRLFLPEAEQALDSKRIGRPESSVKLSNTTPDTTAYIYSDGSFVFENESGIFIDNEEYFSRLMLNLPANNLSEERSKLIRGNSNSTKYLERLIGVYKDIINKEEIGLGYGRETIPIHILSQNPLIVDGSEFEYGRPEKFSITDNINRARKEGYDSLVIENIDDTYDGTHNPATQYAVWDLDRIIDAETGQSLAKSQELCALQERETPPEDQYFTEQESLSQEQLHAEQQLKKIHPIFLDEKGRPKVIYHGSPTGRDIDECGYFDESFYGKRTGIRDLSESFTIYGTDDINVADTYAHPIVYESIDKQKRFTEFTNKIIESLDNALYFVENNELERYSEEGIKTIADNALQDDILLRQNIEKDNTKQLESDNNTSSYINAFEENIRLHQIIKKYNAEQLEIDNNTFSYIFDDGSKIYKHDNSDNFIADKGQYDDLFIKRAIEDKNFWEKERGDKLSIIPIHILSQNPLIVDGSTFGTQQDKVNKFSITNNVNRARKEGYDSLVIENIDDTYDGTHNPATQYAVWDPERVISAETGRSLSKSQEICALQERETPPEDQYFTEQKTSSSEIPRVQQQLERIHPIFLDEKGSPKVIYHGSPSGRTIIDCGYFDEEYYGDNTGVRDASEGFAVFASDNEEVAYTYAEGGSIYAENLDSQKRGEKKLKEVIDRLEHNNRILQDRKDNPELLPLAEQSVNDGILDNYKVKIILDEEILPQDTAAYIFDDNSVLFKVNDNSNEINDNNLLDINIDFYIGELFHTIRTFNVIPKNEHDELIDGIRIASENSTDRLKVFNTLDSHTIDQKRKELGYDRMVLPIHILSQNPLIVDGSEFGQYKPGTFSITDNVNRARKEGYDSLVIENIDDTYDGTHNPATQYAVWDLDRIIDAETGRSLSQSQRICELQEQETPPEDQYYNEVKSTEHVDNVMNTRKGPYSYEIGMYTAPEDQYLMVNIHGAYDNDNNSRRLVNRFETIPTFDSDFKLSNEYNLGITPEISDIDTKVLKYFKNKPNHNYQIKPRLQYPIIENSKSFVNNKKIFHKKDYNDLLYQEQLIAPNYKQNKLEKYIKQGVMAHVLHRV